MVQETMFATAAGTFYAALPFEELAGAVQEFRERAEAQGPNAGWMMIPLAGGERTMVDARAVLQVKEAAEVQRARIGFC